MLDKTLSNVLKWLLLAVAVVPLVYAPWLVFPYVLGKALFFRVLVELAILVFLALMIRSPGEWLSKFKATLKNPLVILVLLFLLSAAVSTCLADNVFRAFWGEVERMEGLFTMLHFVAFFLMAGTFFGKKDWFSFIKISLGVGAVLAVFGILQVAGVEWSWLFNSRSRPDVFLGNSSYTGGHFLALLFLAVLGFLNAAKKSFWRYIALEMMVISLAMIFLSATRGAIVALFLILLLAAIYFWKRWIKNRTMVGLVVLLVLFLAVFGLTRGSDVWQAVPGLDRMAKISFADATVQTRLIGWGSSWEAIKEKPVFGWGLENYNVAYNQYYNPDYALYEAAWFDRAHNKLFDMTVMQGWLGLLLYLAIFGMAIYQLWRLRNPWVGLPLVGLLVAYFAQNLFVFDHMSSYVMFYAVLGMVITWNDGTKTRKHENTKTPEWLKLTLWLKAAVFGVLIIFSLYAWHYVPYRQASAYIETIGHDDAMYIDQKSKEFLYPYTYAQSVIRSEYIDFLNNANAFSKEELVFLTDKALAAYEEVIEREPYDARYHIRISEAYNERAKFQPEFYGKSEEILRGALELSPNRQDIYYHLAFTLFNEGERAQAVEMAQKAVELNPEVGRSHYILGVVYSLVASDINDSDFRLKGEEAIAKAFELEQLHLMEQDYVNLGAIYSANIVYYVRWRDAEGVLRNAKPLKEISPDIATDVDQIVELVNAGNWTQVDQLLKIR
ncbi:MAG: O-antigen ligase family protein [Patescibacteria group bacterium]